MKRRMQTIRLSLVLAAVLAASARAEPAAHSSTSVLRADFLKMLDTAEKKVVGLAEATPQEKYSFRPGEGVRSTGEVFVHIGGANFFLPKFIGIKPPDSLSNDAEKTITEKAKVIEFVKAGFSHLRKGVEQLPEADYTKPVKFFGNDSTVQGVLFRMANHLHEHLGQSIAYARMSGITPPWSKGKE